MQVPSLPPPSFPSIISKSPGPKYFFLRQEKEDDEEEDDEEEEEGLPLPDATSSMRDVIHYVKTKGYNIRCSGRGRTKAVVLQDILAHEAQ